MIPKIETIWLNWGAYLSAKRFEFGKLKKLREWYLQKIKELEKQQKE